jgi:transcription antitermination protein NusB
VSLLYEAELKSEPPSAVVAALAVPPDLFTVALLAAVEDQMTEIDAMVGDAAIGWDVDRLAVIDRNVLRLAVAELIAFPDVPTAVILNEAVDLASGYSTDESGSFVNGILATLAVRIRG